LFAATLTLITGPFLGLINFYQDSLLICAALSIVIGTLGALNQFKLKRLMAYSAISHIGFILIGLASLSLNGFIASFIYFILYIVMTLLTFTIIINIAPNSANPLNLLIGLSRINPLMAISLTLCLLSIAGVPPLAGFLSKFYIINSALQSDL
jgi:NADH-quinone oxidoreductase subunit N